MRGHIHHDACVSAATRRLIASAQAAACSVSEEPCPWRGKANSGITPGPRLFSASGCLGPTEVVTPFHQLSGDSHINDPTLPVVPYYNGDAIDLLMMVLHKADMGLEGREILPSAEF